jgi:hypothetical protein
VTDTTLDDAPAEVTDLAESCVRFVKDALGLALDYTPDTLPILDHYLREGMLGAKPEVAELLAPAAGAYFGEVVRRNMAGARWHAPNGDYPGHRLEFDPFFLSFNPMGTVMEALLLDDAPGWGAHFEVLEEARELLARSLQSDGEMPAEDYYTLSVRWEALERIADLLGGLESKQSKRRRFGPEVYRAWSGQGGGSGLPS